jgi:3-hydroxybenzoate 6-monooxygenase
MEGAPPADDHDRMEESMKTPHASDVLVTGGGIGGVATAVALRSLGASVALVERAAQFGEVGAGLQLAPNATRILRDWGLLDRVREISVAPKHLVFRDALTGEELLRQRTDGAFLERYGAPYLVAHRSDLHAILVDHARGLGVELVNGVTIDDVSTDAATLRATARSTGGHAFEADVVVAADGLQSRLRRSISADDTIGSHYVAYRGALPMDSVQHVGDLEDVVVWLGPECHMVQYPLRGGEMFNTVAVFKSRSFERGEEEFGTVEELREAYSRCVPEVQAALENLWQTVRWPMYDRDPIDRWVDGRMVLVGDAAHPMLQYLAQGACQAIEDAAALQTLADGTVYTQGRSTHAERWDEVLAGFAEVRAPRTARVQRTARQWGDAWHVRPGIAHTLRNMLFSAHRETDFGYTDWLYGDRSDEILEVRDRILSQTGGAVHA